MALRCLVLLALVLTTAQAGWSGLVTDLLCNSTIDSANASGVVSVPFHSRVSRQRILTYAMQYPFDANFRNIPDPAWAMTVSQANGSTESTLWYSTGGANYSDDLSLQTDACAQIFFGLPKNLDRLIQDDPGDCSKTLSKQCREAIITQIESTAFGLTYYASPPPYSNLSAGVIDSLCNSGVFNGLNSEQVSGFPKECVKEFSDASRSVQRLALTGHNVSIMDYGTCHLDGAGRKFYNISTHWDQSEQRQAAAYDKYARDAVFIMSVFFDVANVDRMSAGNPASAQLRCIRPKSFAEGSRVAPALPSGTPYTYSHGVGGGAIAGIVVGVVVLVALVAGVVWWVLRRRRRSADQARVAQEKLDNGNGSRDGDVREVDNQGEVHELTPIDRKLETDSSPIVEMGHGDWKRVEMHGDEPPRAEMGGDGKRAELP